MEIERAHNLESLVKIKEMETISTDIVGNNIDRNKRRLNAHYRRCSVKTGEEI